MKPIPENRFLGSMSTSSIRNLLPKSITKKNKTNSNHTKLIPNTENTPPNDPNIQPNNSSSPTSILKKSPLKASIFQKQDPPVKVIVRIKPVSTRESVDHHSIKKISDNVLSIGDKEFTFDAILDPNSKQEDIFQLVGVPLVESALAGFNTSVLAYGQTGSGKTYTMWGPPSGMVEDESAGLHQGIVPRILRMLFSKIQKDQENSDGKVNYQCRCSFLEIYDEQIGDLLDPTHRHLEIKDDNKNGIYVENLREEYITTYEDVTQILIKGLSSRKVGATSINSKSSRSHVVFMCILESWCKGTSSKCFGSSKTSRISFIDLAGHDRNRLDDAGRQCMKEGKFVKKSISKLGNLVNILAERTQSEKPDTVLYKSSCLTHLLRESLGGNTKLTVICAISAENKSNGETMSTLRFGLRAKCIRNEPVINERSEDDVNGLSDHIRQLKEELLSVKSNVSNSGGSNYGKFRGLSVRESLNQLKVSLNRSLILLRIDSDCEEELHIDENDVRAIRLQLDDNLHSSSELDMASEHYASCPEESENEEISSQHQDNFSPLDDLESFPNKSRTIDPAYRRSISISTCRPSSILQDPPLSESPKLGNAQRKSVIMSSSLCAIQDNILENSKLNSDVLHESQKKIDQIRSSLCSSKIFMGPTKSLASSLQRGLEVIDYHQSKSASNKSLAAFSFEHLTLKPCETIDKADASVQTLSNKRRSSDGPSASFICSSCRQRRVSTPIDAHNSWIVPVDDSASNYAHNGLANQVSKDWGKGLAGGVNRKELENICKEQAAKIDQLTHLVEQYKHNSDQNAIIERSNSRPLEDLKNEILPINELHDSLKDGNTLLRWDSEPEIIKEVHKEDRATMSFGFDMSEKEAPLGELEGLRSKLQSNVDASPNRSAARLRSSSLSQSFQLRKSSAYSRCNNEEELEKERERWTEMESDWISLTDELRIEIESNRQRVEKVEMELKKEKKCTEELDDALKRSILGHVKMVEHYAELQEKYNDLVGKHQSIMEGIADVKRAAAKAGAKGQGSRFAKSLASELSILRVERERARELLRKENKSLKIQLRDTAEAVHAAGQLLVRLRESEEAAAVAEENFTKVQEENEKLKNKIEKQKRKHKMEMITMKQYIAESRLPEAALQPPIFREDSDIPYNETTSLQYDDQAWRAEFGAIYQEHF